MPYFDLSFSNLAALLLVSAFVKIFTTLNIARFGIGLEGAGFGLVIAALSLGLAAVVMEPYIASNTDIAHLNAEQMQVRFRPFLEKHTDKKIIERLARAAKDPAVISDKAPSFNLLVSAFLVTELKAAFQLGFLLLLPFLLIDLLVTNLIMLLGVTQISSALVSLPLKILLFFAVDGWTLVAEKLLKTYQ